MFSNQFQPLVLIAVLLGSIPWSCGQETSGEHLCPVAFCTDHQCEHSDWTRTVPFGKARLCLVWRIEKLVQFGWSSPWQYICHVLSHFFSVVLVMKLLLPFRSAVWVLSPEAKSLVGSHKSRLGLAHCWGWLRFAVEPQPNSPSAVRRRSVYSPEPWPTSGFTAGLHARDIIPSPLLLYHPSTPLLLAPVYLVFRFFYSLLNFGGFTYTCFLLYFNQVSVLFNVLFFNALPYRSFAFSSPRSPGRLAKLCFIYHYNKHMRQGFTAKWQVR